MERALMERALMEQALMERALMERCAHWATCFLLISPKWLTFQAKDMHIRE